MARQNFLDTPTHTRELFARFVGTELNSHVGELYLLLEKVVSFQEGCGPYLLGGNPPHHRPLAIRD
jgi:hypothetical protein